MTAPATSRPLPRVIAAFDRAAAIPEGYSPARHLATSLTLWVLLGGTALYFARNAAPVDWLLIPAFWIAANLLEWAFHRGPMHKPSKARFLYVNHTLIHHRAFLHDTMPVRNFREFGLILMPWYTMVMLLILATPVSLAAGLWRGPPAAAIFYVFAVMYFMSYEILHGLYHVPEGVLGKIGLGKNRIFRFLQAHHAHHHRLDRMSHSNFNVTVPLWDTLLGTREKPVLDAEDAKTAEDWEQQLTPDEKQAAEAGR